MHVEVVTSGLAFSAGPYDEASARCRLGESIGWHFGSGSFWEHTQPALSQDGVIFYFVNEMLTTTLAAVHRNGKQLWTAPSVFDISSSRSWVSSK